LVIHRAWSKLGFKLWTWLAWLITFNFINIAWVFFRAKEWDDALKVLYGMFGMSGIILPKFLSSKLSFLKLYGIEFGDYWFSIGGSIWMVLSLFIAFILIFKKNSHTLAFKDFQLTTRFAAITAFLFIIALMDMNKISEFLYFNF